MVKGSAQTALEAMKEQPALVSLGTFLSCVHRAASSRRRCSGLTGGCVRSTASLREVRLDDCGLTDAAVALLASVLPQVRLLPREVALLLTLTVVLFADAPVPSRTVAERQCVRRRRRVRAGEEARRRVQAAMCVPRLQHACHSPLSPPSACSQRGDAWRRRRSAWQRER
jgi:hypothetical protein